MPMVATAEDGCGLELEGLVGPKDVGLVLPGKAEDLSIEARHIGAGRETKADLAQETAAGIETVGVQRDNFMPHSL